MAEFNGKSILLAGLKGQDGNDGADGVGWFYTSAEISEVADSVTNILKTSISPAGNSVTPEAAPGDIVVGSNGVIAEITYIGEPSYLGAKSFGVSLKGAKGDKGDTLYLHCIALKYQYMSLITAGTLRIRLKQSNPLTTRQELVDLFVSLKATSGSEALPCAISIPQARGSFIYYSSSEDTFKIFSYSDSTSSTTTSMNLSGVEDEIIDI